MTDERENDGNGDVDWLRDAFERANRGDNGTVSDTGRPAFNPFATGPMQPLPPLDPKPATPRDEEPASEQTAVPVVEPVRPPEPTPPPADDSGARRHDLDLDFETENMPPVTTFQPITRLEDVDRKAPTAYPATEALDALELPDVIRTETTDLGRIGELFGGLEPQLPADAVAAAKPMRPERQPRFARPTRGERSEGAEVSPRNDPSVWATIESQAPSTPRALREPGSTTEPRRQLALVGAGIGIVVLALGAFLGGRVVGAPGSAPIPSASATPTAPTAAQPPGTYSFAQLFGGECLSPFDSPWAPTFTVVDCSGDHAAQLVYAGDLAVDGSYPSYPGDRQLGGAAMAQCQRKGVLNLGTANAYTDLQIAAAYPPSQSAWESGDTRYYCFATRSSGDAVNGSIAGKLITKGTIVKTPVPTPTS